MRWGRGAREGAVRWGAQGMVLTSRPCSRMEASLREKGHVVVLMGPRCPRAQAAPRMIRASLPPGWRQEIGGRGMLRMGQKPPK